MITRTKYALRDLELFEALPRHWCPSNATHELKATEPQSPPVSEAGVKTWAPGF